MVMPAATLFLLCVTGVATVGYVTFMALSPSVTSDSKVQVYRQGQVYAIVAQPGWTEDEWDASVPAEIQTMAPGDWNFQIIEGCEVWTINLKDLERP